MSRQVYPDITLETPHPISAQSVFQILFENGWSPIKNEEITYLPIGDNGMYDWTSKHIQIEDFMKLIGLKEDKKEIIGCLLYTSRQRRLPLFSQITTKCSESIDSRE